MFNASHDGLKDSISAFFLARDHFFSSFSLSATATFLRKVSKRYPLLFLLAQLHDYAEIGVSRSGIISLVKQ